MFGQTGKAIRALAGKATGDDGEAGDAGR
jgi:hypothetical protein